jgi:hypothetical protein
MSVISRLSFLFKNALTILIFGIVFATLTVIDFLYTRQKDILAA